MTLSAQPYLGALDDDSGCLRAGQGTLVHWMYENASWGAKKQLNLEKSKKEHLPRFFLTQE